MKYIYMSLSEIRSFLFPILHVNTSSITVKRRFRYKYSNQPLFGIYYEFEMIFYYVYVDNFQRPPMKLVFLNNNKKEIFSLFV